MRCDHSEEVLIQLLQTWTAAEALLHSSGALELVWPPAIVHYRSYLNGADEENATSFYQMPGRSNVQEKTAVSLQRLETSEA